MHLALVATLFWLTCGLTPSADAQGRITSPKEHFGFAIGDDYQLATYTELIRYWTQLDRESDRLVVRDIGKTVEGRAQLMAIITAPANIRRLDRIQDISRRLALAEGLTDEEARRLAAEGRAVVWIDGGIHANEVLGAQQLIDFVYRMVSQSDAETLRILNDVVILASQANPDGMELVSEWYRREPDPSRRTASIDIPRLYQKYAGHDNNRDFYMSTQPETENINRVLYHEWFPQIVYDHHQTGPEGTVMFAPPFRDPFNYFFDPLIPLGIDLLGAAMHGRFAAEAKPGVTMRKGSTYSTWWNGGLRTTPYFHNMIGLLTETIGHPTPTAISFVPDRQLPSGDLPYPIAPQRWHFRQSIEYSWTANRAVLDVASRFRESLLFNIYRMGRNAIQKGSQDTWTITPSRLSGGGGAGAGETTSRSGAGRGRPAPSRLWDQLHAPQLRDPRGYIIPADQPDFLTAVRFVNVLIKNGITVLRAVEPFRVAGKSYPAGSFVVKTAQAFRPFVLDMFEPQDHPQDFAYPGGPPIAPYDSAGWTVAYQMGVGFDRVLDGFDGPFQKVMGLVAPEPGVISGAGTAGYLIRPEPNDTFAAANRLLAAGDRVFWLTRPWTVDDREHRSGTMFVPARAGTESLLETLASEKGLSFSRVPAEPSAPTLELKQPRVGIWDRYGGAMSSGWLRYVLEQFDFRYGVVYPQDLDAGNLNSAYDVLVFPDGAIPSADSGFGSDSSAIAASSANIPEELRPQLGSVTRRRTIPELRRYLEAGGTIVTIGSSASLARHLGLPLRDHLVDRSGGSERPLARELFYVPGSLLRVAVDSQHPIAFGAPPSVDVYFDSSPVFTLPPARKEGQLRAIAWFDSPSPLRSGWAWGQHYLEGGVAMAEVQVGLGTLIVLGPEVIFRAQPHGTFRFLFNALFYGPARRGAPVMK